MQPPRICLCIREDDLRAWVLEELMLMTWVARPTIESVAELSAIDPAATSVIVVDIDPGAPDLIEQLRARTWTTPVIAIGAVDRRELGLAHVLGPRLTSRELKVALRATLFDASRSQIDRSAGAIG